MLRLGDDWKFAIDEGRSRLWLGPHGDWGFEVVCERRKVDTSDGIGEMLSPKLRIDGLMLEGVDWRELVGLEIYQQGPWLGEGEPEASLQVVETSELRDTRMVVTAVEGQKLVLEMVAECDVYVDDDHDTNVALSLEAALPFDGVRFRFRAEGADSRDPVGRAIQLLALSLAPEGFGKPTVEPDDEPGVFSAHFPPATEEGQGLSVDVQDLTLSGEERLAQQGAIELLEGMVRQEWLELSDPRAIEKLAFGFAEVLDQGGSGPDRAGRVVDWLIEQDGVEDVHCMDDELAPILDKFWG